MTDSKAMHAAGFSLAREIAAANAAQLEKLGVWPVECEIPAFLLKGGKMGQPIESAFVNVSISIAGRDCEQEATVEYIYCRAFGAICDGSGPISPPEPENAEIQRVMVSAGERESDGTRKQFDILHLLTDDQVQAVVEDVLEQRG